MNIIKIREQLENELKRINIELGLYSVPASDTDLTLSPFNQKGEAASQRTEFDQKQASIHRLRQQVSDIEHALFKMDNSTYGLCDDCGKPIPEERLKVMPQANLCIACKAKQHRALLNSCAR